MLKVRSYRLVGQPMPDPEIGTLSVEFITDAVLVVVCGADGQLRRWALPAATASTVAEPDLTITSDHQFLTTGYHAGTDTLVTVDDPGDPAFGVRLWDATTGHPTGTLTGHTSYVFDTAFSPDGRLLATASDDTTARLWTPATRQCAQVLRGHTSSVWSVAFSPDGHTLATAGGDATARLWDAATGRIITTLAGHDGDVHDVAFSPDGQILATAGHDTTVRLWDVATGQRLATLAGHDEWLGAVLFGPAGRTLVSIDSQDTARVWNTSTGQPAPTVFAVSHWDSGVQFSPDGRLIALSGHRTVQVVDAATGQVVTTISDPPGELLGAGFSADTDALIVVAAAAVPT